MIKLIQLELWKNNLTTYLWAALWIFLAGLGFCFLFAFVPQLEAADTGISSPPDMAMFTEWRSFIILISILFVMAFSILSAVMHTKFTVDEYVGKRALLLFSYPQNRGVILFAKCSLVFVFTALMCILCNTLAILLFAFVSNIFQLLPAAFELSMLPFVLSISGICGLLSSSIGLIAMRVGFWKKSLAATIVTSVILIAPFGNIVSLFPQYSSSIYFIGMGVLLIAGLLIFMELLTKVNKMEAL